MRHLALTFASFEFAPSLSAAADFASRGVSDRFLMGSTLFLNARSVSAAMRARVCAYVFVPLQTQGVVNPSLQASVYH